MTYGCAARGRHGHVLGGGAVSHLAELVRGDFLLRRREGPFIRPFGAPSPQGRRVARCARPNDNLYHSRPGAIGEIGVA
jgi:hypothetical protein